MNQKIIGRIIVVCCFGLLLAFAYSWNRHPGDTTVASLDADQSQSTDPDEQEMPASQQIAAPDFTLPNVETGQTVTLSDQVKKSPVVFSFWATWCGPCNMELPVLEGLSKKYSGRIAFFGIDSSDDAPTIKQFIADKGYTMPMLLDQTQAASGSYAIQSIPRLVVVGTDGKIKYQIDGFDPDEDQFLPGILDHVLAESH